MSRIIEIFGMEITQKIQVHYIIPKKEKLEAKKYKLKYSRKFDTYYKEHNYIDFDFQLCPWKIRHIDFKTYKNLFSEQEYISKLKEEIFHKNKEICKSI